MKDDGGIGILIDHLSAFSSGELIRDHTNIDVEGRTQLATLCAKILSCSKVIIAILTPVPSKENLFMPYANN